MIRLISLLFYRYVKEWLCLMVIGDIIEADDKGTAFFLPVHGRKSLTTQGGLDNYGIAAAGIPMFVSGGFDSVVNAAKEAGPKGSYTINPPLRISPDSVTIHRAPTVHSSDRRKISSGKIESSGYVWR